MKVGFGFDVFDMKSPSDGKHKFLIRLANQMKQKGINVTNKNCDIYLRLIDDKPSKKAKINIVRLNGLIMNSRKNYERKNKNIIRAIEHSDAIVYQSNFCEKAHRKFLGITKKPYKIIYNGASSDEFLPRNPKNFFLANGKWRPHKRLKTIIESFLLALDMGLDSDLIVTGIPDYKVKHNRIKYIGWQDDKKLQVFLSEAIASLHLTWLDWCPNAMVEAIVAGCPIIYSNSGGHREMGQGLGIPIKDIQWKFNVIDLYDPPSLDKETIAIAMIYLKNSHIQYPQTSKFDIKNVCQQYVNYFKELIG